ncbi:hypothetical protein [Nocardia sp. NRRL S-836]|uniref:hypothetical protein n=1 Tax=Nocardia sp. NRRL S-836 TaxID=1519492 RepID=UPI0006AE2678|nr:hypothetical protein [Nocardia sp. NRRL S-836]KOV87570.1 hypothetical protein ADL03_06640 [Nocardia sp. NRRL S-836]
MGVGFEFGSWALAVLALSVSVVTLGVVLVALIALAARKPSTRRHCLQVLTHLTQFVLVLRGKR